MNKLILAPVCRIICGGFFLIFLPLYMLYLNGWQFRWIPTSLKEQALSETQILQRVRSRLHKTFLNVSGDTIRTIVARNYPIKQENNSTLFESNIPIVLVHGFASGVGLWCKTLDALSASRRVYAFDLVGFGRSSRRALPQSAENIELFWIQNLENWTRELHLEKFILVGHSLGGYLVTAYAINFPEKIVHLVLVDPWGFEKTVTSETKENNFVTSLGELLNNFGGLRLMRLFGPFGPLLLKMVRPDLATAYKQFPRDANGSEVPSEKPPFDSGTIFNYVYQMNAHDPSGEEAFNRLGDKNGDAINLILPRVSKVDAGIPMSFVYGRDSWIKSSGGYKTQALRSASYVNIYVIEGAGHQAFAEKANTFNAFVNDIAAKIDAGYLFIRRN